MVSLLLCCDLAAFILLILHSRRPRDDDIAAALRDMLRPNAERLAFLRRIAVAIIDSRHALHRSAFMVQDGFHNMRRDTVPGHAARGRAAQIVKAPRRVKPGRRV